jgi:hypothetical protein
MKSWRACVTASAATTLMMSSAIAVPPLVCGVNRFPTAIAQGYGEGATYDAAFTTALHQYWASQTPIWDDLKAWQAQSCPTSPPCTNRIGLYPNGGELWSTGLRIDDLQAAPDVGKHLPAIWYVLLTNEYSGALLCSERKVTVEQINRQITRQIGVPPAKVEDLKIPETLKAPPHAPLKTAPLKPAENMGGEKKAAPPK